jgi:hypothetical protein
MVHVGKDENDIRLYIDSQVLNYFDGNTHQIEVLAGFETLSGFITDKNYILNYDPEQKIWTTDEVIVDPPAGDPVELDKLIDPNIYMQGAFGTVYFYFTGPITNVNTINAQASATQGISENIRNGILDCIKIDGKTIRAWLTECESEYAAMIAFENQGDIGQISIWSNISENPALNLTPDADHVFEFLEGLTGLNGSPIAPVKLTYKASTGAWLIGDAPAETTGGSTTSTTDAAQSTGGDDDNGETPNTGESIPFGAALPVIALFTMAVVSASRKRLKIK